MKSSRPIGYGHLNAILLDLDGTLVDSIDDVLASINVFLARLGARPVEREFVCACMGKGVDFLLEASLASVAASRLYGIDQSILVNDYIAIYRRRNGRSTAVYPQVREGLARLRAHGVLLACVTNKPEVLAQELLEHVGLADFIKTIVGGDTLPEKKPSPLPLAEACRRLRVSTNSVVMIGDAPEDVLAARRASIPVWGVSYGYRSALLIGDLAPDVMLTSLVEAGDLCGAEPV